MLAADFFVVAGRVGLSINHALAYDLPTLAYDRGPSGPHHGSEFHYLIDGMTGFVVRDTTTAGLTRKLEELFANGWDWKRKLKPGIRDFVRDHLAPERMLEGFRAADAFVEARRSAN
jgi:hypothetical protein